MNERRYKFLSLDLWDTVIRRKCHPDAIKMSTARYLFVKYNNYIKWEDETIVSLMKARVECERELGNKLKKQNFDDEYNIKDVFMLWINNALASNVLEKADEIVEELYQYELECEKKNSYLDPTIVQTIEKYDYEMIGYISDFYAGTDFLDQILKSIACPIKWDVRIVSCEYGYNKRSGRLFQHVLEQLKILPEEQIHMGDNSYSDYQVPRKAGIEAVHYIPKEEHRKRKEKEAAFSVKENVSVSKLNEYPKNNRTEKLSVFFYGYVSWILERCLAEGIKKIFFFTREGEFYKAVYDEIANAQPYGMDVPESQLLEVSRLATFGASLREVTIQEMMRIWNQYSCQSLKAFFTSIGVNIEEMKEYTEKYNLFLEEVLVYPWQDERVQQMFNDKCFIACMQEKINSQRELLVEYCEGRGMRLGEKQKIAIVDIGWRGTIQDNLCHIFSDYKIYGYYIGLIGFLNEQPQNSYKDGYLNYYKDHDVLLMLSTPFEMVCNSPNGSTVGYERRGEQVIAVRKKEESEDTVYYRYTDKIQKSVINKMKEFGALSEKYFLTEVDFRERAYESLEKFIFEPDGECAKVYFKLVHNEEFGVGNYVDKRTRFRPLLMIKACFSSKYRTELKNFLRDTTWPQGYLVKYRLYPALYLYNKLLKKYYKNRER